MCCRDRRLSFRFIFPPTTIVASCPATEFPIFLFYFLPLCAQFLRWWWWWCRRQQKKETNKICLFFIFFRVVAPSSSLSRTLANSRLGFSISLRVLGNLDFFLLLYRKPAQLLSRDFHRLCDVVVVVVCPFTDRPTDIRRVNKKKTTKQQNKKLIDF